jgi:hypothetical protein
MKIKNEGSQHTNIRLICLTPKALSAMGAKNIKIKESVMAV